MAEGRYRLYNARNTAVSLTVYHAQAKNGANVKLSKNGDPEKDTSFADVWQLSYRADGTAQLINVYAGKSLDVAGGKFANKTNVQIWTDTDSRAQAWDIVPSATGRTVTIGGTSYPTFFLRLHAAPTFVADAQGYDGAANRNVQLYTKESDESTTDQLWAFVPVPAFEEGMVYEMRPAQNVRDVAAIAGASTSDGARAMVRRATGDNSGKVVPLVEVAADGETPAQWSFRWVHSGRYMDAYGGTSKAHDGQAIGQYASNGSLAQRWDVQRLGGTRVGGVECDVVSIRSSMTDKGSPWYLDAYDALHSASACVRLRAPSSTTSQQWVMVPTTAEDPTMPVPTGLGLVSRVGGTSPSTVVDAAGTWYPTWTCPRSWASDGPNHYEVRHRSRLMDAVSGAWRDWTEWTEWEVAGVTLSGDRAWLTEGVPASVHDYRLADGDARDAQWELQVRSAGAGRTSVVHGLAADAVLSLTARPSVTLSNAGVSVDGLHLDYQSDYAYGENVITIRRVVDETTGLTLFRGPKAYAGLDEASGIVVPLDGAHMPGDGDALRVEWDCGNDRRRDWGRTDVATLTAAYDAGHGADVTPTLEAAAGHRLRVSFPDLGGSARAWMVADGVVEELAPTRSGGTATAWVPYAMGGAFSVMVASASADGDRWGTARAACRMGEGVLAGVRACHAWTWDDGAEWATVEFKKKGSSSDREWSVKRDADALSLDSRRWRTVALGVTSELSLDVDGLLVGGRSETDAERMRALALAGHVTYRDPLGGVWAVAVTGVTVKEAGDRAEVSVNQEGEAL